MKVIGELISDKVIVRDEKKANSLHAKGSIGLLKKGELELSLVEAFYLIQKNKIELPKTSEHAFIKKAVRKDKRFRLRHAVFKDLRDKGYVIKTALKYGFDYRVYDKGVKPGKAHAKWLIVCYDENERTTWKEYSKTMRVAHSVRKSAIIAVVDDEGDVTYYEANWVKI
jgi:tRNA-intron endonuclease